MQSNGEMRRSRHHPRLWRATLVWSALYVATSMAQAGTPPATTLTNWPVLRLSPQDRILVLAPHPDDEVIACGGIIQTALAQGLPIRVVFLTYGDNNELAFMMYRKHPVLMPRAVQTMGQMRHDEAVVAAKVFGLSADHLTFLGYPDFGTLHIWESNWDEQPAYHGMLTRVSAVPYANAFRPKAPYKGEEIVKDLSSILREFRPTKIFVSHPADHNGDHQALYLFTRVALWDLEKELRPRPELYPYLVHFRNWPQPRGDHPTRPLEPPDEIDEQIGWNVFPLSTAQVDCNRSALKGQSTEYNSSRKYLTTFLRANELFGDFPAVTLSVTTNKPAPLSGHLGPKRAVEPPKEPTDTARAVFVGLHQRFVSLEDDDLVVSIGLSQPLGEGVETSIYLFGYRNDRPFGEMPKLCVKFGESSQAVFDQNRRLKRENLEVIRRPNTITVRVNLSALGDPQRVLCSARSYLGDVPMDWVSWRALELPHELRCFAQPSIIFR
jgi:LmbE family N-acetylglucosaminyl deacetylase